LSTDDRNTKEKILNLQKKNTKHTKDKTDKFTKEEQQNKLSATRKVRPADRRPEIFPGE